MKNIDFTSLFSLSQPVYILSAAVIFAVLILVFLSMRLRHTARELEKQADLAEQKKRKIEELREEITTLKIRNGKLVTLLSNERKFNQEKIEILEDAREQLRLQFQSLAQEIFDEKSEKFGTENKERISSLLQPLQEQLHHFQKRMDTIQANDIRERTSLKEEIIHLRQLNQQINKDAVNLTRALKGDKKLQGNWGELVLEKVLEKSGLRKGDEYTSQEGFRDQENQLLKPDIVIHLPEGKDIIIDSKFPLSAWEKYINCEEEDQKKRYLKEHLTNLRTHINSLSSKNYTELTSLQTLDFVLLFIPIDSSFIAAYEEDENLYSEAYSKKIIIVTPTTLLATLKTIENIWRYEHQNRNAKDIADRAGAIYNKLCSFLEEMEKIGKQLDTCRSTYDNAMNRLAGGRGNVISQAAKLTQLGVSVKKKIPRSFEMYSDQDIPN